MFSPSERQETIRRQARGLYDQGFRLVGEWCRKIPELTPSTWHAWERTSGFMEWWVEMFPEHSGTTVSDLRALEFEANRAIMLALADGDLSAAQLVIKMSQAAAVATDTKDATLDDWFVIDAENGWTAEA
jgi:hypothetical protein